MATSNPNANSVTIGKGRYAQGGTTEEFSSRLGWWERIIFEPSPDDITYTIRGGESGRADMIAYRMYQKATLAWVVLQYNNIVDPAVELQTGTVIKLPTPSRVALTITTASS